MIASKDVSLLQKAKVAINLRKTNRHIIINDCDSSEFAIRFLLEGEIGGVMKVLQRKPNHKLLVMRSLANAFPYAGHELWGGYHRLTKGLQGRFSYPPISNESKIKHFVYELYGLAEEEIAKSSFRGDRG